MTEQNPQDQQAAPAVIETAPAVIETALTIAGPGGLQIVPANTPALYIKAVVEAMKADFIAVNDGLDMDFVNFGEWLTIDKKGNYVEKDDANVSYGDTIDGIIVYGEQRWSVWGKDDTPESGQLLCAAQTQDLAEQQFSAWLMEHQDRATDYSLEDIRLRYFCQFVPVATLDPNDMPRIYLMSFSPSDTTRQYAPYARGLYMGKYKAAGIPSRTAPHMVVTRLITATQKNPNNASQSWVGNTFQPVGLFDPADYGMTPGVEEVPFEGHTDQLHKDEDVLTATDAAPDKKTK